MTAKTFTLQDIEIEINGQLVGTADSLSVSRSQANEPVYTNGSKHAYAITRGSVGVSGSISKVSFEFDFANSVIDFDEGNNPEFTMIGSVKTTGQKFVLHGVVMNDFEISPEIGSAAKENYTYVAEKMLPK